MKFHPLTLPAFEELIISFLRCQVIHLQTVRSNTPEKTNFLRALAQALPGKLEIWEADNLKEGSYDEVVQGAKYV